MDMTPLEYASRVAGAVCSRMDERGVSVKALSEGTRIPRTTLSRRLEGSQPFEVGDLFLIASFLETTPESFFAFHDLRVAS